MHEFLAKLTDLHHKMLGLSVVYVPQEGINMPLDVAAKDKEFVRRLEGIKHNNEYYDFRCCKKKKHYNFYYQALLSIGRGS